MPRRARLSLPNVPLHIIQRGNNRQACLMRSGNVVCSPLLQGRAKKQAARICHRHCDPKEN